MLCEFMIGRHAQSNTARAYSKLANGTAWKFVGYMGVLTAALIIGYDGVVSGWTLQYVFASAANELHGSPEYFREFFNEFSSDPAKPIVWMALIVGFTHFIIVHGILPVNLSQALLTFALVDITQPIVRLNVGKGSCRTKAVNQQQQTVVIVGLMCSVQLEVDIGNLLDTLLVLLSTRDGKQYDKSQGNG